MSFVTWVTAVVLLFTNITPAIAAALPVDAIIQHDEDYLVFLFALGFIMLGTVAVILACMDMLLDFGPTSGYVVPPTHQYPRPPANNDKQSGMDQNTITKALLEPYRVEVLVRID